MDDRAIFAVLVAFVVIQTIEILTPAPNLALIRGSPAVHRGFAVPMAS
jgi:hypothetical protein